MSRASKNLCFLLAITVVNVVIYLTMSGHFPVMKGHATVEKSKNVVRLANGELYQERMSQLVKEALRDRSVGRENLTMMLERAMKDHIETLQPSQPKESFVHSGKTQAIIRTPVISSLTHREKDASNEEVEEPVDGLPVGEDMEAVMNVGKHMQREMVPPSKPHRAREGGILTKLGSHLFPERKEANTLAAVFPHDYNLVINEPNKCRNQDGSDRPVFFLVLIMSVHKNFDQRNAIRRTWGSPREIDGMQVVTLFLLAKTSDTRHQRLVEQESQQYHDLLMEDFVDTYKNLTIKTMMAMKWASIFCPHANFVMKTDDDMYIGYASLVRHLSESLTPTKNYVTGYVIRGGPIRDPKSKWYMPRETYPGTKYPPFCSGTGYVMSGDMPGKIFQTSLKTPFLYLEDVYVAVCLDALHVVPVTHREFNNWRTPYSYCKFKRIFTTHMVTPTEMHRIWSDQQTSKGYRC